MGRFDSSFGLYFISIVTEKEKNNFSGCLSLVLGIKNPFLKQKTPKFGKLIRGKK